MTGLRLNRRERWTLGAILAVVFVFSLLRFDGPTRGYWDTYITVPAMFMTGQRVELVRIDGSPRFSYELAGRVPADTFDPRPGSFGIASKDQRIGACILFGAPFALFAMAAFRWVYAAFWALLFLFSFLAIRRLLAPPEDDDAPPGGAAGGVGRTALFWIPLVGALVLVLNTFSLYLDRLNGNLFGLVILTFLFFLLQERRQPWWLIGLVYGLLGGIRNEAIIVAPMIVLWMWARRPRTAESSGLGAFARSFVTFGLTALVGILPVLLWNRFAYGAMIIHPSQVEHLQGFRPTFAHSFFGAEFQFNGLLNWPFHDEVVRTPHFAYPTALMWPLVTIKSLGVLLAAAAPFGVVALVRRRRLEGWSLVYWYVIVYALFIFQENWEELKQTFMALHLFPLAVFVAFGVHWVARAYRSWVRWAAIGATAAALAGMVFAARYLDIPADERWYVRFPHAGRNDAGLAELPEELRKDWQFFYTRETPAEIDRERAELATPSPLPQLYRPFTPDIRENLREIVREPFQREHTTLAIWSYIYE